MKAKFLFLFLVCTLTIACSNKVKEESTAVDPVDYMVIGPADSYPVCSDTLGSEIRMKMIQGNYTIETKEVFAIVLNPKCLSLGYGPHWSLEKWECDHWITPKTKSNLVFLMLEYYLFLHLFIIALIFLLSVTKLRKGGIVYPNLCMIATMKSSYMLNLKSDKMFD